MSNYPLIASLTTNESVQVLWRGKSRSGRVQASQLIALGAIAEAQLESNRLQSRLCEIAEQTNHQLAEIRSSLQDIAQELQETNSLLRASLTVQLETRDIQKEQLRLLTRERVLKDFLFRWGNVAERAEASTDKHFVAITCHLFRAFLRHYSFTTADLSDRQEKKEFVDLEIRHKRMEQGVSDDVASEVNTFLCLYAEHDGLSVSEPESVAVRYPPHPDTKRVVEIAKSHWKHPSFRFTPGKSYACVELGSGRVSEATWDRTECGRMADDEWPVVSVEGVITIPSSKGFLEISREVWAGVYRKPCETYYSVLLFSSHACRYWVRNTEVYARRSAKECLWCEPDIWWDWLPPAATDVPYDGQTDVPAQIRSAAVGFFRAMEAYHSGASRQGLIDRYMAERAAAERAASAATEKARERWRFQVGVATEELMAFLEAHPEVQEFFPVPEASPIHQQELAFEVAEVEQRDAEVSADNPECPINLAPCNEEAKRFLRSLALVALGRPERLCNDQPFALKGSASDDMAAVAEAFAATLGLPFCAITPQRGTSLSQFLAPIDESLRERHEALALARQYGHEDTYTLPQMVIYIEHLCLYANDVSAGLFDLIESDCTVLITELGDRVNCENVCWVFTIEEDCKCRRFFGSQWKVLDIEEGTGQRDEDDDEEYEDFAPLTYDDDDDSDRHNTTTAQGEEGCSGSTPASRSATVGRSDASEKGRKPGKRQERKRA